MHLILESAIFYPRFMRSSYIFIIIYRREYERTVFMPEYNEVMTENPENIELAEVGVEKMQAFLEFVQIYNGAIREITTKLNILDEEFKVKYAHNPIHHMESRLKSTHSMIGKLRKKGLATTICAARENLLDIAGVRVICPYIDDIYRVADMLTAQGDIRLVKVRDYIARPKENGYRSLHIIVKVPVFLSQRSVLVPVEVQIRTIAMDFWASLEHKLRYKGSGDIAEGIPERLARCAETSAMLDLEMQDIYRSINGLDDMDAGRMRKAVFENPEDVQSCEHM